MPYKVHYGCGFTLNRAMTAEKKHMKAVANTNDLVTTVVLPRTNFCKVRSIWLSQSRKQEEILGDRIVIQNNRLSNLDHRLRYPWLSELQAQEFLFTCMCTKKASWTTIALTIMMQVAARNACFFHLRKGSYKETEIFLMSCYNPSKSFRSFRILQNCWCKVGKELTSIEYTLPSTQLMSRAENSSGDWNMIPIAKLWKMKSNNQHRRQINQQTDIQILHSSLLLCLNK